MKKFVKMVMGAMVEHPTDEMVEEFVKNAPYATLVFVFLSGLLLVSAILS